MKFLLLLEGQTEEKGVPDFLRRWLARHFTVGVGVQPDTSEGWADLRDSTPKKAARYLSGARASDIIAVVSLLDLYGPTFYPPDTVTVAERHAWGTEYMEQRVRDHFQQQKLPDGLALRYRHFFAVHETEAWFLAQPSLFKDAALRQFLERQTKPPETVNFTTPPGRLLERQYLQKLKRRYSKTTNARNFFPQMDAEAVAARCPYLAAMLHELRRLALVAGVPPQGDWHQRP